jgi:tetratricopeptide (TPR) repeat protein
MASGKAWTKDTTKPPEHKKVLTIKGSCLSSLVLTLVAAILPGWLAGFSQDLPERSTASIHPPAAAVQKGQKAMYRLQYAEARRIYSDLKREFPASPVGYGMLNVLDWNELLFATTNPTLDDYSTPSPFEKARSRKPAESAARRFHQSNSELLKKCDEILDLTPRDPVALYFRGLAYENLAAEDVAITRSRSKKLARRYGDLAREYHAEALALDPAFVDAHVSLAVHEYAAANLPLRFRWLTFILGIRGDEKKAFERLRTVSEKGRYRRYDALILSGFMRAWKRKREYAREAVQVFETLRREFPENYLLDFNLAAIYEHTELNDPKSALRTCQELLTALPTKAAGLQPGEVHYRIGRIQHRLQNFSQALDSFRQALLTPASEEETKPLAHYYMGLIHEAQGADSEARTSFRKALESGPLSTIEKELADARRRLR